MATQVLSTLVGDVPHKDMLLLGYAPILNGDDGAAIDLNDYLGVNIQFTGTLGVGGSIQVEGSNDPGVGPPTNWSIIGVAFTAMGMVQLASQPRWIRVHCTAGDGTTAFNVQLCLRRNRVF